MNDQNAPTGQKIPLTLLTGFLGSGKTTVLNRLLADPALANALVLINEFGEIGIDHDLIAHIEGEMIMLQSGCLCCTVKNDFIETLRLSLSRRSRGEMPHFNRVIIETTGLADPLPILQLLMTDILAASYFCLDGIIATVDAAVGLATLDEHLEAVRQAAVADRLLLTKTDLTTAPEVDILEARLRTLNPTALVSRTTQGFVDASHLLDIGAFDPTTKSPDVRYWLGSSDHNHSLHRHDGHDDKNRHDTRIRATSLVVEAPIAKQTLNAWLQELFLLKGPNLLRFKGIINVQDMDRPLVLHGVQQVIHPPVLLERWPSEDHRTRLVFITQDLDGEYLRALLKKHMVHSLDPV